MNKISELTKYNEDLKKFQLDKDFQINELNTILISKEKVNYYFPFFFSINLF